MSQDDTVERAIALITRVAPAAKDDTEPQWLLQAVKDYCKRVNVMMTRVNDKSTLGTL